MQQFYDTIHKIFPKLTINIVDVGSRDIPGEPADRYVPLIKTFPGSKALCFDAGEYDPLDIPGRIHKQAVLGRCREQRDFYETDPPSSSSLYRPAETLANGFPYKKREYKTRSVETITLDEALAREEFGEVDLLKLDVQGGEFDVLKGATQTLAKTLVVISEVEFVPLYENQPLFGDVCDVLKEDQFHFHRFYHLTVDKEVMEVAPVGVICSHLWGNALFMPHRQRILQKTPMQAIKMGLIANQYECYDIAGAMYHCYDIEYGTSLAGEYRAALRRLQKQE